MSTSKKIVIAVGVLVGAVVGWKVYKRYVYKRKNAAAKIADGEKEINRT